MSSGNTAAAVIAALGWAVAVATAVAGRWPLAAVAAALGMVGGARLARGRAAARARAAAASQASALWPARRADGPWPAYDRRRTDASANAVAAALAAERRPRDEAAPRG
jgi:hypothetical protein